MSRPRKAKEKHEAVVEKVSEIQREPLVLPPLVLPQINNSIDSSAGDAPGETKAPANIKASAAIERIRSIMREHNPDTDEIDNSFAAEPLGSVPSGSHHSLLEPGTEAAVERDALEHDIEVAAPEVDSQWGSSQPRETVFAENPAEDSWDPTQDIDPDALIDLDTGAIPLRLPTLTSETTEEEDETTPGSANDRSAIDSYKYKGQLSLPAPGTGDSGLALPMPEPIQEIPTEEVFVIPEPEFVYRNPDSHRRPLVFISPNQDETDGSSDTREPVSPGSLASKPNIAPLALPTATRPPNEPKPPAETKPVESNTWASRGDDSDIIVRPGTHAMVFVRPRSDRTTSPPNDIAKSLDPEVQDVVVPNLAIESVVPEIPEIVDHHPPAPDFGATSAAPSDPNEGIKLAASLNEEVLRSMIGLKTEGLTDYDAAIASTTSDASFFAEENSMAPSPTRQSLLTLDETLDPWQVLALRLRGEVAVPQTSSEDVMSAIRQDISYKQGAVARPEQESSDAEPATDALSMRAAFREIKIKEVFKGLLLGSRNRALAVTTAVLLLAGTISWAGFWRSDTKVVALRLQAPGAQTVAVIGDFNDWAPGATPMTREAGSATWKTQVTVAPGRYRYRFLIDGRTIATDSARAGDPSRNVSVLDVPHSGQVIVRQAPVSVTLAPSDQ